MQRQKALEKNIGCEFITFNPDEKNFNIFKVINEINRHIKKSTKEINKKSLINELSCRLLKMRFKSDDSIKRKLLKYVVKKDYLNYKVNRDKMYLKRVVQYYKETMLTYCLVGKKILRIKSQKW